MKRRHFDNHSRKIRIVGWEIECCDCCGLIIINASSKKNREDFSSQTVKRKITVVFKEAFRFLVARD